MNQCFVDKGEHIRQYDTFTDVKLNGLVQTALDVENLFGLICKEDDADSKHIYFFLFKVHTYVYVSSNRMGETNGQI